MRRWVFYLWAVLVMALPVMRAYSAEPEPTPVDSPTLTESPTLAVPDAPTAPTLARQFELQSPPQPDGTPTVLEFRDKLPDGASKPTGRYSELASIAIDSIVRRNRDKCAVQSGVYEAKCPDGSSQTRLVLAYACAPDMTLVFKSNCSVNSQFDGTGSGFASVYKLTEPEELERPRVLKDHVVADICAHWTLLNHGWYDESIRPKTCRVTVKPDGVVDASYTDGEVQKYNRAVSRIQRHSSRLASR